MGSAKSVVFHQPPGYKQKKSEPDYQLESLIVYTEAEAAEIEASLFVGSVYGKATNSARTLVNTPGNLLTASDLADYAVKLADRYDFDYEIL
ncbi:cytosol aminopeptidase [Geobacillus sp. BCO2]|nr:cytosol aminopeptidase [Geobacillus sp. BCO2]